MTASPDRSSPRPRRPRPLVRALVALGVVLLVGAGVVLAVSEWRLRRRHDVPLEPFRVPAAVDTAEGRRMATIVGCWAGCHGLVGEGGDEHIEGVVRHTAPTLSDVLPRYSDEELVRLIRHGVKRDGGSALGMISYTFWPLGDADLANIIAHLRAQPPRPPVPRRLELAPLGRLALATGAWTTSADQVDRSIRRWGNRPRETPFERGRHLASVTCSECHGLDFRGNRLEGGPSLALAGMYRPEEFRRLMRTGVPLSGRDLGIMSWVAREGVSRFTDREIADLHAFLLAHHGLADSAVAAPDPPPHPGR